MNYSENEKLTDGSHISYWTANVKQLAHLHPLNENTKTDVVIVGGGLAGLSVAYCLLKSGKKVVLVEDGYIGSGETGRTTAHLVTALDDRYYNLQRAFGVSGARLIAESHRAAIDFIEKTCFQENKSVISSGLMVISFSIQAMTPIISIANWKRLIMPV